MTRSQAEELLKQEVSVWPQVNGILLAQNVRILNWGLAAARQARQCQDHHFYWVPITLFCIKSNEATGESRNLALKAGVVLFSPRFGQMGCRCEHHFLFRVSLFFLLFQGKEGGFIVRDSSKAGKYTVSVFAKSTGWVLLFQGPGDKRQGCPPNSSLMVCPSYFLCPLNSKTHLTSLLGSCMTLFPKLLT